MTGNQFRPGGFSLLPPVVKNLLIINGLAFLAYISLLRIGTTDLNDLFGLHYLGSEEFQPYQLITYMFMHGGWAHIFFNMFALWMFGSALENYWGPKKFIIYYLITGVGAALIHYGVLYFELKPTLVQINSFISDPSISGFKEFVESKYFIRTQEIDLNFEIFRKTYNDLLLVDQGRALEKAITYMQVYRIDLLNAPVVVGASGSVFGLLLAFGMTFPNALIYVFFAIPVKAKWFVIIYGVLELYLGISNNPGDNVAHFAHLGGMIFGFILIKLWKKKDINRWMY
jgi:membrane associated rhomboid family serine protease